MKPKLSEAGLAAGENCAQAKGWSFCRPFGTGTQVNPRSAAVLLALGALLCFGSAVARAQYLPALGPAPVVWEEIPTARLDKLASLPPLLMKEPEPALATNASSPALPAPATPAAAPSTTNTAVTTAAAPTPDTNQAFVEPTGDGFIGPPAPAVPMEVLAPFLSSSLGTNRATVVTLPLNFSPPAAAPARSSTATYTTSPP